MKFFLYLIVFLSFNTFAQTDPSHFVPADKHLSAEWKAALYADGPRSFSGDQLKTIGMPCGGIASGQMYVRGDGTLAGWWIANNAYNTGNGWGGLMGFNTPLGPWKVCYQTFTSASGINQGFTIQTGNKKKALDKTGFPDVEFTGEYPLATINYKDKKDPWPLTISLKVYSPFIPLDAKESATPGTIMQYTLKNNAKTLQTVTLSGHLQNMVGLNGKGTYTGTSRNRIMHGDGITSLQMDLVNSSFPAMHPWNGNLSLNVLSAAAFGEAEEGKPGTEAEKKLGDPLTGIVGTTVNLKPGETRTVTFLLTWYFPNRPKYIDVVFNKPLSIQGNVIGNNYANWFDSSNDVALWLKHNLPRLQQATFAFHDAYYSTTIPYWLSRRLLMPLSTLATETCQWWGNGKFWAWEGVGSCIGTCTHVWNYEQGLAHLFPELERNIREQTDLSASFRDDGAVLMRNGDYGLAIDGQAGTILKCYREYLLSKDELFLTRNWQHIKAAMNFLIRMDGNADGMIEGVQPNTYDIEFFGSNTYIGSLYLGALKAAERMAMRVNDKAFADSCAMIAVKGSENSVKKLYNGEYFIQEVNLKVHPDAQYGKGCLSDQLFGQTWAHLDGLGYLYPENEVRSTLAAVWKYNWAPDVAVQTVHHQTERDFADAGEPGLLNCTWPHSPHPEEKGIWYRDEVWTGIEYQVATNMIYEGMTAEGLSVIKAIDSRYQPEKHNPWNEVECGDHYARAMASWGVLIALEDFQYNGPEGSLAFAPQIKANDFKAFFSAAEGWGTLSQHIGKEKQVDKLDLVYGHLRIKTLKLDYLPKNHQSIQLSVNGKTIPSKINKFGNRLQIDFDEQDIQTGGQLAVTVTDQ